MTERQAWFCPSCQKHHAPYVETCPGPALHGLPPNPIQTVYPYRPPSEWEPKTGNPWPTTCGGITVESDPNIILVN